MAVKQLKKQLIASILSVAVAFVALASSTYAWYVSNNTVDATTSTIAAKTDNFVLQVAKLTEGAQHGTNQSLVASSIGHKISPSSTNDLKDWYASLTWGRWQKALESDLLRMPWEHQRQWRWERLKEQ